MGRVSLRSAVAEVAARDPVVARLVELAGPMRYSPPDPDGPFGALVRAIVYQQLAGKAAEAIHRRVRGLVDGPLTPEAVLALDEAALRGAGLSANKMLSVRDLAAKVADGTVLLDAALRRLPDDELIDRLVTVRGIGRWTAEMFLLFELRRLDVWPVDDLGVRVGYGLAWGVDPPPTSKELQPLGDKFRPYRSISAWYCWRAVHLHRAGVAVWDGQ